MSVRLKYGASIISGLCAVAAPAGKIYAQGPERPNVLFIAVDDLKTDWINCYGGYKGKVYTPHIDKLAAQGVRFTRTYCPVALCGPSRTALLTGKYPRSTGIYAIPQYFRQIPSTKDLVTLPQYFQKNGYYAIGAGKIFHGPSGDVHDKVSWDAYSDRIFGTPRPASYDHADLPFKNPDDIKNTHYGPLSESLEETRDGQNAAYIADFLRQDHDRPFFAAYGVFRPHTPWFAPKKFFDLYPLDEIVVPECPPDDLNDIPPVGKQIAHQWENPNQVIMKNNLWKEYIRGYLACISFADTCVGNVLDALENSKYRDNTIVVFWSDNGWHLGEKEHWHKATLWEQACRVPLIIKVPGVTPPDTQAAQVTSLVDLYPTLVELCGLPPFDQLEGESLVPVLKNPAGTKERAVVTSMPWNKDCHSIVNDRYRYIRYNDGGEELYDHERDPGEWTNLANNPEYEDLKQRMKKQLKQAVEPAGQ